MNLKKLTDRLLDEQVEIDGQKMTKREALLLRIIHDAIGDEDPAIRSKAAALVLDLVDYAAEKEAATAGRSTIVNQNGEEI